ncbi:16S rRNA (cytidine(1402)-2'-O)-methyltransferase [Candidatus Poribacteria bacterium]|nr:MAG: 16S rRNA (cytidine(1402)-2'-O)-methyltransferase [Candidatus Poribacteria bacterium]
MAQPTDTNPTEGVLYIVSTPIGNLEDITLRALRTLKEVDLIAAEDTRHTRRLLVHYEIDTPTTSYFEGNQIQKGERLVARLKTGESIALVSDAGTPTISDPGYRLLIQCIDADIAIIPIPGPSACIAAASIAGLPLHNFVFEGFLSPKSGRRKRQLAELSEEKRTLIFYESPHRIVVFLQDVLDVFGDRQVSVARELTKKFEEVLRGTVTEAIQKFQETSPRGEFTIVIEGFLSRKE